MLLDSNLEKIKDFNISLINKGDLSIPLNQAWEYLNWILCHNKIKIQEEYLDFKNHLLNLIEN